MSKYEELKKAEDSRIGQTLPEYEGRKPIKLRRKQPHEISSFGVALLKFVGGIFAWFIGSMFVATVPSENTFAVYMVLGLLAIPVGIFFRYFTFKQEVASVSEVESGFAPYTVSGLDGHARVEADKVVLTSNNPSVTRSYKLRYCDLLHVQIVQNWVHSKERYIYFAESKHGGMVLYFDRHDKKQFEELKNDVNRRIDYIKSSTLASDGTLSAEVAGAKSRGDGDLVWMVLQIAIVWIAVIGFLAVFSGTVAVAGIAITLLLLFFGIPATYNMILGRVDPPGDSSSRSRYVSKQTKESVYVRDSGRCSLCGSNDNLEYDHVVPFSKGGNSSTSNIRLLCRSCNRRRGDRGGGWL